MKYREDSGTSRVLQSIIEDIGEERLLDYLIDCEREVLQAKKSLCTCSLRGNGWKIAAAQLLPNCQKS
jgi:hypothetical protein